jgi:hypothetical protein
MASQITATTPIIQASDAEIWDNLKMAIAASSGFQTWQLENPINDQDQNAGLDPRVSRYLRETLETLAY